jgi:hypothetical protein
MRQDGPLHERILWDASTRTTCMVYAPDTGYRDAEYVIYSPDGRPSDLTGHDFAITLIPGQNGHPLPISFQDHIAIRGSGSDAI